MEITVNHPGGSFDCSNLFVAHSSHNYSNKKTKAETCITSKSPPLEFIRNYLIFQLKMPKGGASSLIPVDAGLRGDLDSFLRAFLDLKSQSLV